MLDYAFTNVSSDLIRRTSLYKYFKFAEKTPEKIENDFPKVTLQENSLSVKSPHYKHRRRNTVNARRVRLVRSNETSADRDYRLYVYPEISKISTEILSWFQERAIFSSTNEQVKNINDMHIPIPDRTEILQVMGPLPWPRRAASVPAVVLLAVIAICGRGRVDGKPATCSRTEFACTADTAVRCVPSVRVCDGHRDCPDGSDEPQYCTPCNKTYYGEVGKTYEFELHRPKPDKLPFVCFIKLDAPGHHLGDLIQVTLDSFTIGRFASYTNAGCPDGDLHITESDRPAVSGGWCGTAWAPAHYFSETNSITLLVRLYTLSSLDNRGYNFDFRLGFKMLNRNRAVVRYGEQKMFARANESFHMGELMEGTYCSRIFSDCDKKKCVLQSPNYPGLYPRNLTCYYAIRQHDIPYGHQALISITQPYSRLVSIRLEDRANTGAVDPKPAATRKDWSKCDNVPDFVTVYDGYTTRDPILLRFCGSGETVPVTTSSGPELLVQFSTSPYGTLMFPFGPLHGFQLQVQVHFVEIESIKYTKNKRCEFWIRNTGRGWLHAPYHSLPENTTCWYHLLATPTGLAAAGYPVDRDTGPRYKVWVSVLKFYVTGAQTQDCTTNLMIWDGNSSCHPFCSGARNTSSSSSAYRHNNGTLLANYCPGHTLRSCDHFLLSRKPRPCTLAESFLSTSQSITVQLNIQYATALRPISFKALYEFVDLHQDGNPWPETGSMCSRIFRRPSHSPSSTIMIRSPKNVFFYGRGGNKNLSCVFRLEGQPGDVAKVTINKIGSGDRSCYSRLNTDRGTLQCVGDSSSSLSISDEVNGLKTILLVPRHCLCSTNESLLPYKFVTLGSKASMVWEVLHMNSTEDFRHHHFEATVQFVRREVVSRRCEVKSNLLSGPGGHFTFHSHNNTTCESHFVILTLQEYTNSYLYAKLPGLAMPDSSHAVPNNSLHVHCPTNNRFIVHAGDTVHTVVCPDDLYTVEVFSDGWRTKETVTNSSRDIIIEFIPIEPASYTVSWIQLSSRIRADGPYCHSQCPELDACINETLWCDGVEHCPSGYDESFGYCMHLLYTHLFYSVALTVAIAIVAVSSGLTVLWFRRFRSASGAAAPPSGRCRSAKAPGTADAAGVAACDVVY
ncbi:Hypothetical protein CINCED_3A007418 [Cinara cedri]|uniref:CUB domain-containing protein n=1 Tax=Cinara cedri TaxID=506608 RepID=A0A5E4NKJ2_9HEMI|nr:Hypothetical protein CINCED_3A007418 [Cinara cedri]